MIEYSTCPVCGLPCELTEDTEHHRKYFCEGCQYLIFLKNEEGDCIMPYISDYGHLAGYLYREGNITTLTQDTVDEILLDPRIPTTPLEHLYQLLLYIYARGSHMSRGVRYLDPGDAYVLDERELERMIDRLINEYGYVKLYNDPAFPEDEKTYYMLTAKGSDFVEKELLGKECLRILRNIGLNDGLPNEYVYCNKLMSYLLYLDEKEKMRLLSILNAKSYVEINRLHGMEILEGMCRLTERGLLYLEGLDGGDTQYQSPINIVHQNNTYTNNGGTMINEGVTINQNNSQIEEGLKIIRNFPLTPDEIKIINDLEDYLNQPVSKEEKFQSILSKMKTFVANYGSAIMDGFDLLLTHFI